MTNLNISSFPTGILFGSGEKQRDLADIVRMLEPTLKSWAEIGLIKSNTSFGFAMTTPVIGDISNISRIGFWDAPHDFIWFVAGWGEEQERYIANAIRKMRAAIRKGADTLSLQPEHFQQGVDSAEEDGTFKWGDFPHGGASFVTVADMTALGAVSSLRAIEDDVVAKTLCALAMMVVLKQRNPEKYAT